ncbi:hypothetical protein L6255_01480 [Candidatus Parcubacteria bacterium]|nr:hypothetical protein [Candidatus Parcubacteria bacterium]
MPSDGFNHRKTHRFLLSRKDSGGKQFLFANLTEKEQTAWLGEAKPNNESFHHFVFELTLNVSVASNAICTVNTVHFLYVLEFKYERYLCPS